VSAVTAPRRRARDTEHAPQQPNHLQVVEAPPKKHTLAYALSIVVLLGAATFGAVSLNALAAAAAVETRTLDAQVADSERLYAQLVADVAALEDPARIRDAATDLGLEPASSVRHLTVERNLPADGVPAPTETPERTPDPLKPLLSAER
jgi:cell division protein FtsL